MITPDQDPLELLRRMQRQSLANAPGLPQETEAPVLWSGVGFRLGDLPLLTPLGQVREILPCPPVIPVPGARPWIKGIANVRGTLITVADLALYYGKPPVFVDDKVRLMILNVAGFNAGVLVNEVLGLRHFDVEQERREPTDGDDPVMAQVTGAFERDNVRWSVFDMTLLAESPSFRHAAA